MTQYIAKWTPFRWAYAEHCLQQGGLNVGNIQQNRINLANLCIANANSTKTFAKWRVGEYSRTSTCGLLVLVTSVPGYVDPQFFVGSGTLLADETDTIILTDETGTIDLTT